MTDVLSILYDKDGKPTDDEGAVRGEVVEIDDKRNIVATHRGLSCKAASKMASGYPSAAWESRRSARRRFRSHARSCLVCSQ